MSSSIPTKTIVVIAILILTSLGGGFYAGGKYSSLETQLELQDRISRLESSVEPLQEQIAELELDIKALNSIIDQKDAIITEKNSTIQQLENENQILLQNITDIMRIRNQDHVIIGYIAPTQSVLENNEDYIENVITPRLNRLAESYDSNVTFIFETRSADGQAAVHIEKVQELHSLGIDLIIGGGWSSQAHSSLSYCNDNDILLFSHSSTSPLLAIPNDNLFRMCVHDLAQAPVIAEMLFSKGIEAVIVIQRGDSWADGIYNEFIDIYQDNGGDVVERIRYAAEVTAFSHYLQTADDIAGEAINEYGRSKVGVLILSFSEIASIVSQIGDYSDLYSLAWFGSEGTALNNQLLSSVPEQAAHLRIYSTLTASPDSALFDELSDEYYAETSQPLGYYSACLYDVATIIAEAVLASNSDRPSEVIPLITIISENHIGASGWCKLDINGDRLTSNYQIWGYGYDNGYKDIQYGYYNSQTEEVTWFNLS